MSFNAEEFGQWVNRLAGEYVEDWVGPQVAASVAETLEKETAQLRQEVERLEAERKGWCLNFYYWWHNQEGTNTDQGYQQWLEAGCPRALEGEQ